MMINLKDPQIQEVLKLLDLCDNCKLKLRVAVIEKEFAVMHNSPGMQHIKTLEDQLNMLISKEKKLSSKLTTSIESKPEKTGIRLSYSELFYLYPGNPMYRGRQTKGFREYLKEKGYPEYIFNPEIKKKKLLYRDYKINQEIIEQHKNAGYALP